MRKVFLAFFLPELSNSGVLLLLDGSVDWLSGVSRPRLGS
jgi:hypothetical protein